MNSNFKKVNLNAYRSKNKYVNIKSKYILQNIFYNLERKKMLDIIKYNKKMQNRIDISIIDYIEYRIIEIEIIPDENEYGKFINVKKEDEQYYHIYFNDNSIVEIKRNYLIEYERVYKIIIKIDYEVDSLCEMFYNCLCIKHIYFRNFYRKNINNMSYMFSNCSSLKVLDLSNFNSINVTNMSGMFSNCSSLKELNLSNIETKSVKDMSYMFSNCRTLEELNFSNFNTINVSSMDWMFHNCSSLKELDLTNFNTYNLINVNKMFSFCSSLKVIFFPNNYIIIFTKNIDNILIGCSEELIKKINYKYKKVIEAKKSNEFINDIFY